ncbi:MAG: MinD/ParA family protein [Pseudomonadales bacterium]
MLDKNGIQVIAVTGGKGGVGKSNVSINLGLALLRMHRRVALLDADLGLANIDVLLGLRPEKTLEDVLSGECSLREVLIEGPQGMWIVPSSSGSQSMVNLSVGQHAALIDAFNSIDDMLDVLLIDTAAGIDNHVINFVQAAHEVIVVVCDEPSSLTDAYALIKLTHRDYGKQRFRIVSNMTDSAQSGRELFEKIQRATDQFLDVTLQYAGHIPFDEQLRRAVRAQKALLDYTPRSKASQAFRSLAEKVDRWPKPSRANGQLEFFLERLVAGGAA